MHSIQLKSKHTFLCAILIIAIITGCVPITPRAAGQPAAARGAHISGRAWWGSTPAPAARVELRTGAWATAAARVVASTVADANGNFVFNNPPLGDYGLVAVWPDGGENMAAVTPVQITAGAELTGVNVYLARELELIAPVSGAVIDVTPTLRWQAFPGAVHYRVRVVDAGTTELMVDQVVSETSLKVPHSLGWDKTYTWLVQALAADGSLLAELENTFYTVKRASEKDSQS
jgi:hypothetical protein